MPTIRVTDGRGKARVDAFYASAGRRTRSALAERVVIAEEHGCIVGVVRLCEEEGHCVLRTMFVKEALRGKGLGVLMLKAFEPLVQGRDCYCLSFDHLTTFYGQIGFVSIPKESAPDHLRERLEANLRKGDKMLVMLRPACLARHEDLSGMEPTPPASPDTSLRLPTVAEASAFG
jgi:N-acetylglutamate synthase-like GNAT family acetyltransferase